MSDNNNTLGSYVDSATGTAQRAVNSVTGGTVSTTPKPTIQSIPYHTNNFLFQTQNEGQNQDQKGNPTWDQTMGSAKESVGNALGHENLRQAGVQQNVSGKDAEAKGQLKDLGQGVTDRAQGAVGSVGAAIKGDREEEEKWRQVHDEGKGRQKETEKEVDRKGGY